MRHRWCKLAAALALALLATGCWNRIEVEDQAYLIALGLDQGSVYRLKVTAVVALVQTQSTGLFGGQVSPEEPRLQSTILTAEADTVTQAIHVLNGGMTRRLDLRHVRLVVVGEPLAKAGLEAVLMELTRSPEARGAALLAQGRGSAAEILSAFDPVAELNPAKAAEGITLQAKQFHLGPPVRMHHFVSRLAAPGGDPFMPVMAVNLGVGRSGEIQRPTADSALPGELPREGGNPVEFVGTAIFRGDRLAGFLTVDETQMLLALRGEMGKAYISLPDPTEPDLPVTMRFHQENLPQVRAAYRGKQPYVTIRLLFEGELLAEPSGATYVDPVMRPQLEQQAVRFAERTAAGLLEKLKDWGADPVGFGHLYRGRFATWQDWVAYRWGERVPELEVVVAAKMRIRRYGLILGTDRATGGR